MYVRPRQGHSSTARAYRRAAWEMPLPGSKAQASRVRVPKRRTPKRKTINSRSRNTARSPSAAYIVKQDYHHTPGTRLSDSTQARFQALGAWQSRPCPSLAFRIKKGYPAARVVRAVSTS